LETGACGSEFRTSGASEDVKGGAGGVRTNGSRNGFCKRSGRNPENWMGTRHVLGPMGKKTSGGAVREKGRCKQNESTRDLHPGPVPLKLARGKGKIEGGQVQQSGNRDPKN